MAAKFEAETNLFSLSLICIVKKKIAGPMRLMMPACGQGGHTFMDTDGSNGGQAGVLRFPGAGQLAD